MSGHILIIDDDPATRKLLTALLARAGFRTLEAADAETGLSLAGRQPLACILMDLRLPGMDGLEATRLLKADPSLRHIPVVAITGQAGAEEEQRALAAGCDGFLSKPFDTHNLLEYLQRFLRRTEQAADTPLGRRARILIADDEPTIVQLFDRELAQAGYERLPAHGGQEALRRAWADAPDLILLDVLMPDLDGFEVTRRLKGNLKTAEIPIILVTGLDGMDDKLRGLEAGADEFLSKPVATAELLVRIKSMLRLAHLQEQLAQRTRVEEQVGTQVEPDALATVGRYVLLASGGRLNELERALEGQRVLRAASLRDALTLAKRGGIDLVLAATDLPDGEVYELCRQLKELDTGGLIPVALLLPAADSAARIRGIEAGADEILPLPIEPRELSLRLAHLFRRKDRLQQLQLQYRSALCAAASDALTGLNNHGYFRRFLDLEVKRSLRKGHPTALLLLDVDDFKHCNDTLGHLAGDIILKEIAQIARDGIREIDLAARYGGEEFAVVLPYTDRPGGRVVAERLRARIGSHPFLQGTSAGATRVTVSIGVAVCPADGTEPERSSGLRTPGCTRPNGKARTALSSCEVAGWAALPGSASPQEYSP